jgi:hypothetical protein
MASQQKKQQKKKDREKAIKAKNLIQREKARKERKMAFEQQKQEKELNEMIYGKKKPILNSPEAAIERDEAQSKIVVEKLKRNLEILEALEKEYDAEQENREKLNQELELEGHLTIKEKMDALHQKALDSKE